MQIKTINEEGCAKVQIVGGDGTVHSEATVEEGHEVTVTATTAHSAEDLQIGEVQETSAGETAPDCGEPEAEPESEAPTD